MFCNSVTVSSLKRVHQWKDVEFDAINTGYSAQYPFLMVTMPQVLRKDAKTELGDEGMVSLAMSIVMLSVSLSVQSKVLV